MGLSDIPTRGTDRIVRVSAAEAVFNALRSDIEGGHLAIGEKLPSELVLSEQYGVSRSVVREALRSCAALGLTATHTGKGTYVLANRVGNDLSLGSYSARDLLEARPHIEVPAAGLAALRRSEAELQSLRDIVTSMDGEEDPEVWVSLDFSFHSTIARTSGNRVFENVLKDIRDALSHQSETLNVVADRKQRSDEEHLRIFRAIELGLVEEAETAMREHLAAVRVALGTILGGWAGPREGS